MMMGSTVYVFSIILATFLIGLAIGSTAGAWISRTVRPRLALGWCQILLTLGIAWAAYMIAGSLPYWPIDPTAQQQPVVHLPARHGALPVGDSAAGASMGRQFPAGAGGRGRTRAGSREGGWKRLCRQHPGRDRGSAARQPDSGAGDRHAAVAAGTAGRRRRQRVHGADSVRARSEIGGNFRIAGGFGGAFDGAAVHPSGSSWRIDRLRPPDAAQHRPIHHSLHCRGAEFVGRDFALEQRRDLYQRQRARGSHHRDLRHEAAADGGPSARPAASESEIGSGDRVWRGRFRRNIYPLSRDRAHHDLRNRAGDPADLHALLRQARTTR